MNPRQPQIPDGLVNEPEDAVMDMTHRQAESLVYRMQNPRFAQRLRVAARTWSANEQAVPVAWRMALTAKPMIAA